MYKSVDFSYPHVELEEHELELYIDSQHGWRTEKF